ncbi:ATP-binding protein [Paracoccus sp. Z118]|uniref:ATP-binding protein n=1 Tax=Paracoccus sp. Z118 TaxID=2851017 RepID=UPI001C2B9C08|nr:ATP-binding protein [Paracoccus sp. Z118]MBV0892733.1 ATP-binding protein [Paracoccus sp. Z118]
MTGQRARAAGQAQTAGAQALFHRVLPADRMSVRQTLTDLNARLSPHVSADVMGRVELVLAEVMNNIVLHGAEDAAAFRRIHLSAACHRNGVACAITDDGVRLPGACLAPPPARDLPPDAPLPEGGFGWLIIHDLTQSLAYFREDQRNLLAFNIPLLTEPQ